MTDTAPSLAATLARLALDGTDYTIGAPEDWSQGRTLFGGMTAALAHDAVQRAFPELPPLRSAQFAFIGPASGALRFRPELLRQGKSSAVAAADCRNADGLAARATFTFGVARESAVAHDRTPRLAVPPADACDPFHKTTKPLSGFLARFEFRLAGGARILTPDAEPEFAVWVRLRDGVGLDPVTALLAITDSLPSAAWVAFPKPAPVSTMTWTVDLHQPLASRDAGGWHLVHSSSQAAAEGYSIQHLRVFDADGAPLASSRQVVALFV